MKLHNRHKRKKRRKLWRKFVPVLSLLLLFAIALPIYGFKIEPYWLQVKTVPLTLPHLASEFDGYRIVQLSDLHIVDEMPQRYLERVIRVTNRQQPDLIAITGDIVTDEPQRYASRIEAALQKLEAPTVSVMGNHDHWSDPTAVRQILKNSRVIDISNGVYDVYRKSAQLHIAGVDDVWAGAADLDLVMAQLPDEGAAILLAHEPDFADTAVKTHRFDLELSGHAHGGQVTIPFVGPPVLPPYGKRYPVGQYQIEDLIQYTNRGIGMVSPRARFGSRPEITVFQLSSAQAAE
ncbi:3',5'-cyclic adenosine monophosphate phosphodiesterase CpdA [Acaryochloris thomasi RCC1774]|uniref:3',5'-cyclic adenosine monophosphate phosphodiesterase CpdA n=1 Tax=Acaryochloris thomasi RCC1774 TaxID=1764569 RepID=A0A2W1JK87_9CYAN|nr:metallophosphoesterase [Acaryochloris thomasi]PZD73843.1 3',5'-cyclic adenosine monophosphate phosphodiesterase CpdA [Acaryochloris thomasi RCC1774]